VASFKLTDVIDLDNPVVGDIHITDNEITLATDDEEIVQELRTRLQFFKGEWFLDRRQGVPYFEEILVKRPNLPVIRAIFRDVIVGTNGIASVETLDLTRETGRSWLLDFTAKKTDGGTLESNDWPPFIVSV
jgi:hypothetical protein